MGEINWYILFVMAGREYKVERLLKERLDSDFFQPFVPLLETLFIKAGVVKREIKPLFSGYVFIESELSSNQFISHIKTLVGKSNNIIRLLRYSDTEVALRQGEKEMMLSLCNNNFCVESSIGIMQGDRIHITDGPLKGRESIIKRINRHKRQATIEIQFMGNTRLVNVSLEVLKTLNQR